jgi:hypothetical protein
VATDHTFPYLCTPFHDQECLFWPGIFVLTPQGGDKQAHNLMQSPKSPPLLRRTKGTISDESENEVYRYLASPLRFTRFATFCNQNVALFGAPGSKKRKQVQNRKDKIRRQLVQDVEGFIQELKSRGLSELASEASDERHDFVQSHQDIVEDALEEEGPDNSTSRSQKGEQVQTTAKEPQENSSMAKHRRGSALPGRYGKSFVSCLFVISILILLILTCC